MGDDDEIQHDPNIIYKGAPEKIWLQLHGDASLDEIEFDGEFDPRSDDVTWSSPHPVFPCDAKYVRGDRFEALQAENERLQDENEELRRKFGRIRKYPAARGDVLAK